jgi:hypothetical protein
VVVDLAADLAALPAIGVDVHVGVSGAHRAQDLAERGRFDALSGRPDDVGGRDIALDRARRVGAGCRGLGAATAEEERDSADDAASVRWGYFQELLQRQSNPIRTDAFWNSSPPAGRGILTALKINITIEIKRK